MSCFARCPTVPKFVLPENIYNMHVGAQYSMLFDSGFMLKAFEGDLRALLYLFRHDVQLNRDRLDARLLMLRKNWSKHICRYN